MITRMLSLALAVTFLFSGTAVAQPFPSKPVRIIVAFPAGGGTDITARVVAEKLTPIWGQQVLVENRAGASGMIGTEAAARSAPDGHTLFMGTMGNLTVNKHLFAKMAVDPLKDFAPVTNVVAVHFVMVAHPAVPAKGVKDLIALAKRQPGQITYGSSGAGGAPHLAGELLKMMAKIDMQHIPYKGSAQSAQDLMGGQIMVGFDSILQNLPQIRSGRLKALAVLGKTRSPTMPEVPTVAESGVPGYDLTNWFGLVLPVATPGPVSGKIAEDVIKVLALQDVRARFTEMGATVVGDSPRDFAAYMRAESEKWAKVIQVGGIRAE
jgi:tripartite-type tricarboxylate transporter receptor subunit TctC